MADRITDEERAAIEAWLRENEPEKIPAPRLYLEHPESGYVPSAWTGRMDRDIARMVRESMCITEIAAVVGLTRSGVSMAVKRMCLRPRRAKPGPKAA